MKTTVAPILLFDGVCNLCQGTVQFVIERDKKATVKFASLQSDFALQQFAKFGIPAHYLDSIVLIENKRISYKSSAALRLCRYLDGLWPAMRVFILVPKPLRDFIYDWVARNRYRWFGKQETCWIPNRELLSRFKV
jgi:predicted DCC family thiol-disulfide oxidoreductase YuxK